MTIWLIFFVNDDTSLWSKYEKIQLIEQEIMTQTMLKNTVTTKIFK